MLILLHTYLDPRSYASSRKLPFVLLHIWLLLRRCWFIKFYSFLPNLFCILKVFDDVHQGIAAGTSLVFLSGAHVFTCCSLFFLSVWFCLLRFGASNEFVLLRDCFVWLVRTLGFGSFCDEFSFSFAFRLPV